MAIRIETQFRIFCALLLLLLIGVGAMVYRTTRTLIAANASVQSSQTILVQLAALQASVDDSISATRAYVGSGSASDMDRLAAAKAKTQDEVDAVLRLTASDPVQQQLLQELTSRLEATYGYWDRASVLRRAGQMDAGNRLLSSPEPEALIREDRQIIASMVQQENEVLGVRSSQASASAHRSLLIEFLMALAVIANLGVAYLFLQLDMKQKDRALDAEKKSESRLRLLLESTAELSNLGDLFQSCQTVAEACAVSANAMPRIFRSRPGALCLTSASRNIVETVATWNGCTTCEPVFAPEDCWALRRGKAHGVGDPNSPVRCKHVTGTPQEGYLCVPLVAQGETLGILYLAEKMETHEPRPPEESFDRENLERLAIAAGQRVALALANLSLREGLRNQSIRDSLTGLFNRRYMEESLVRELHRAQRKKRSVALAMLDLDHFKVFNDTFGHQAGDMLMAQVGNLLRSRVRTSDIACRFGGEEFAIILAEADAEGARACMDKIRIEIRNLHLNYRGQPLGSVTVSTGIAVFPEHGGNAEDLVRAGDQALYRAKASGRDCIVIADAPREPVLEPLAKHT